MTFISTFNSDWLDKNQIDNSDADFLPTHLANQLPWEISFFKAPYVVVKPNDLSQGNLKHYYTGVCKIKSSCLETHFLFINKILEPESLKPHKYVTRAQLLILLRKYVKNLKKTGDKICLEDDLAKKLMNDDVCSQKLLEEKLLSGVHNISKYNEDLIEYEKKYGDFRGSELFLIINREDHIE